MADPVDRSIDKRVVYLGMMLLTLAYPLIALTIIVGTRNDYDDEGHRIKPLPQVTCPVEGAEGDIDCVDSPLAYAHIDSIIWVYVFNEVVMHFSYVLYTKLWATAGIVFGFWREVLCILAFLLPELLLNSIVYLCQTLPFMRAILPSLKTTHFPLLISFIIGAMLSTLYGLGTAQTTDQFRRAVTLAGPGTMFLFVDWFSRSVFLPFFELMQNTFTQLKVNTFLLAIFELVLTNLYGSLFLPATQKLCVVLARFFYNVSYGVDSKVSLYDNVNLRPAQQGLDPSNPLSKRTTLVSPKDIGTYEPEACRGSFSSLARRKHHTARPAGRESVTTSDERKAAAAPVGTCAHQDESLQRALAVTESHTNTAAVENTYEGLYGTKHALHQPAPQKGNDKASEKRGGQTADLKRGDAAGHPSDHGDGFHGAPRKGFFENNAKRDATTIERAGSNGARGGERRHSRERRAQLDDYPLSVSGSLLPPDDKRRVSQRRERRAEPHNGYLSVPKGLHAPEENRRASVRTKHSTGPPDARSITSPLAANRSLEAVDVEVGRCSRTLRASVDHLSAAPHWTEAEGNETNDGSYPGHIYEPSPSTVGNAQDGEPPQDAQDIQDNNQLAQLEGRSPAGLATAEDALQLSNPSYVHTAIRDADALGRSATNDDVYSGKSGVVYCDGVGRSEGEAEAGRGSFCGAEGPPEVLQQFGDTCKHADDVLVEDYDLKDNKRSSRASRTSTTSRRGIVEEQAGTDEVVGSEEIPPEETRSIHCFSNVANVDGQQVLEEGAEGQEGVALRSDKGRRRRSSIPRAVADEGGENAFHGRPAAADDYVDEHSGRAHRKRQSAVEPGNGQGDNYAEAPARRAHRKRQSAVGADHGEADDHVGEPVRRAHGKRQSAVGADYGEDNDYAEEHARRARRKRQSAVRADYEVGDNHVEEPARGAHRKRQSAVEADYEEGNDDHIAAARSAHRKRQSAVEADYEKGDDHPVEAARNAHRKRQSAVGAGVEESRVRDGGQSAAATAYADAGSNAARDDKAAAKVKASRKIKKHVDDNANGEPPEPTQPAADEATARRLTDSRKAGPKSKPNTGSPSALPFPFTNRNEGGMDTLGGGGTQNSGIAKGAAASGSGDVGPAIDSFEHGRPNDMNDEQRPFRSNIYIPYRKGFGSDAVEFEKIITWFNMIWDSWRFLLLRTVMVKASNVFIFFVMIFKDFIYSMWHFCVRYDERCVVTSLELRAVRSRKNKSIVKMLDWFQALVVRPFFMPACLSTTTWRSQLLFGLNAQKAQSRMRGVAVIRHSKRKDFGLRTLSNISDNAPLDAPNDPTPQKAVRGLGVMLKTFFKDLGHDLAAHFKAEMEMATVGFWGRTRNKPRSRFSRRRASSVNESTKLECDIRYAYGSELVVIRNVPVFARSRGSRCSTTFSGSSRSNSETEHSNTHKHQIKKLDKITLRDMFRGHEDSAFRKVHAAWISQVVEELQSLIFNRTWPRLLQKLMSSLSLVVSDIFAENTKVGLLPAYRTFGLFRTYEGRVRLFLIFSFDILEVLTVWKVQSVSRFYKSIKEGFNNMHDGPLLLLCIINCAGTLMYFGLLRYIRFAHIYGDKRILPDVNKMEMLTQLNLSK